MKHIYAFEKIEEVEKYQAVIERFKRQLNVYQKHLETNYCLVDKPKAVVWTSVESATTVFSNLPIPAFTNKNTIYISPDVLAWRELFVRQLDGLDLPHITQFYEKLSEKHVLTILGHELTHHSDLFLDEFDEEREDSIWFEEGMCEYLPRKFLLTDEEFHQVSAIEKELVNVFAVKYGDRPLDEFGSNSYQESLSSIMFDYWRSFLTVKYLVEVCYENNIQAVFEDYTEWHAEGRKISLTEHFKLEKLSV